MNEDKAEIIGMTLFMIYRMLLAQWSKAPPLRHAPRALRHFSHIINSIRRRDGGGKKQRRLVGGVPALVRRVRKEIPIALKPFLDRRDQRSMSHMALSLLKACY